MTIGRVLRVLAFVAGTVGILIQFSITIPAAMAAGRSLAGSLVFFFSFFTILTNVAAIAVLAAWSSGARTGLGGWLASAKVCGGVAVSIAVVAIVYIAVLARLWAPEGWFYIADVMLHYVAPALFIGWWIVERRDGTLSWTDPAQWLVYPLAYFAYAMARAPIAGEVPYPFLDVAANGWAGVASAAVMVTFLFILLSAVAIAADHAIAGRRIRASHSEDRTRS